MREKREFTTGQPYERNVKSWPSGSSHTSLRFFHRQGPGNASATIPFLPHPPVRRLTRTLPFQGAAEQENAPKGKWVLMPRWMRWKPSNRQQVLSSHRPNTFLVFQTNRPMEELEQNTNSSFRSLLSFTFYLLLIPPPSTLFL